MINRKNSTAGPTGIVEEVEEEQHSEAASSSWHTESKDASVSDAIGHKKLAAKERANLGKQETQQVWRLRGMVYLAILFVAAIVSVFIYMSTFNAEVVVFHTQFEAFAVKLVNAVDENLDRKLQAAHTLASAITSYAQTANATFPFVTLPHMALIGSNIRIQAESIAVDWLPLVTDKNRQAWELYSQNHQSWLQENHDEEDFQKKWQDQLHNLEEGQIWQQVDDDTQQQQDQSESGHRWLQAVQKDEEDTSSFGTFHSQIFNWSEKGEQGVPAPADSGPYLPLWQMSPVLPTRDTLNLNMLTREDLKAALHDAMLQQKAVIGAPHAITKNDDGTDDDTYKTTIMQMGQYRHMDITKYIGGPATSLVYPVFDGFGRDRQLGGLLMLDMYWRIYFKDILAEQVLGVVVVLQSQDRFFTYQVDGPHVTYLGEGDFHDTAFDHLRFSKDITNQVLNRSGPHNQAYGAVELDADHHHYDLHVYPSKQLQSAYLTMTPLIFTLVVIGVFLFTMGVFMTYDYYVEQRQVLVMNRAVQSTAIVSSLYPEHVRDRLFQEAEGPSKKKHAAEAFKNAGISRTLDLQLDGDDDDDSQHGNKHNDMPIADMYENTTILFADLAGFTKWSSTRRPEEVFLLLETLYQAFDRIAARRRVFKIETIGDCYVAATGLPTPQEDHAVIMTKFARDCQSKMNQILNSNKILSRLGEDTKELGFRVGMHSGSITGGVLRGQKARFQLFGDTMNTASRMESNGVKGRIHVSEATAEELRKRGKSTWLTPREDQIDFKGKGVMLTYWVHAGTDSKSAEERSCVSGYSGVSADVDESIQFGLADVLEPSRVKISPESDSASSAHDLPRPYDSFKKVAISNVSKNAHHAVTVDDSCSENLSVIVSVCSA